MSGWALLLRGTSGCRCIVLNNGDLIGSERDCEVKLKGRGVQRRHARVRTRHDVLDVRALGGAPLRVGQADVERAMLRDGDAIWFGNVAALVTKHHRRDHRDWLRVAELGSASARCWQSWMDLALAAVNPWPMLILGESGTGKELAARACHRSSARRDGPFVAINCAALPPQLLQAELFGAERGAYTGANERRIGAFERADGGTLLLDEIGDLPLSAQAALLRALQSGEIQVVGGRSRTVDTRVIAATNVDLFAAAAAGRFRLDLLHRLAVTVCSLPPLRSRQGDASLLLAEMLNRPLTRSVARSVDALPWHGNVRELRNVARRLQMICPTGAIERVDLQAASVLRRPPSARAHIPVADRAQRVRAAVANNPTIATAQRWSGLPRSTFFRYLAQIRRDAAEIEQGVSQTKNNGMIFDGFPATASVATGINRAGVLTGAPGSVA